MKILGVNKSRFRLSPEQLIITGVGHRHAGLIRMGFSDRLPELYEALITLIKPKLLTIDPDVVITGMAAGFDLALAIACKDLSISYIAALPDGKHRCNSTSYVKSLYCDAMNSAAQVTKENYFTGMQRYKDKYLNRDRQIIQAADIVLAIDNGLGNTYTSRNLNFAKSQRKIIVMIYPRAALAPS